MNLFRLSLPEATTEIVPEDQHIMKGTSCQLVSAVPSSLHFPVLSIRLALQSFQSQSKMETVKIFVLNDSIYHLRHFSRAKIHN